MTSRKPVVRLPLPVNEALRSHVTRVGFDLTLSRSQIAALVWLNEAMDTYVDTRVPVDHPLRHAFAHHMTGMGGLIAKGMVIHHYDPTVQRTGPISNWTARPHFSITRAGELATELLREAGLYAEYSAALAARKAAG